MSVASARSLAVFCLALNTSATFKFSRQPSCCGEPERQRRPKAASTVRFDYDGAEALVAALARDSLTDADVDRVMEIQGVRAMVDNVTRFHPAVGRTQFRTDIKEYVRTHREPQHDGYRLFAFDEVVRSTPTIRKMIQQIRLGEQQTVQRLIDRIARYQPQGVPLEATVYFVAGGVSDGFVPDSTFSPAFYDNLAPAEGDVAGVELIMTHELYHMQQKAIGQGIPTLKQAVTYPDSLEPLERLLFTTLWEGSAMYVADPTKLTEDGPYVRYWRDRALRNLTPARIRENFALFDSVAAALRAGRMSWRDVDRIRFSGDNDERFYSVGYLMAAAIDRSCGPQCVAKSLERPAKEFFRQYIAEYGKHPEIAGRFSRGTAQLLER
jgi:hypothetical protein